MTISRRHLNTLIAGLPLAGTWPHAMAQARKDSVVLGMVLEPQTLDPTTASAAAIGEIVHYNVLEGLTKDRDGRLGHAAAGRELEHVARWQGLHLHAEEGHSFL
jgi:peptide/nickel transport system substrate-binding protein